MRSQGPGVVADFCSMPEVILVDTFKGGVGKTTTSVSLAYALSRRAPTVLVGTSPQNDVLDHLSSVTIARRGLREYLTHDTPPQQISVTDELTIVPAGYSRPQEHEEIIADKLRMLWASMPARYIVVDGFNFTDELALGALLSCDMLICPTTFLPEPTKAVLRVWRHIGTAVPENLRPRVARALLTQVPSPSRRNKGQEALYQNVLTAWEQWLCSTEIRWSGRFEINELATPDNGGVTRASLMLRSGPLAEDYDRLAEEVIGLLTAKSPAAAEAS